MGMTHTTLETQPGARAQVKTTGYTKNNPSPYLSVKSPSVSLTPVVEEPAGYNNDIYDYDVNINQPLQGDEPGEFILQNDLCCF